MATAGDTKTTDGELVVPEVQKPWKKRLWSDAHFLRRLREGRENKNRLWRLEIFFGVRFKLQLDSSLKGYSATGVFHPPSLAEQLQDICNKATIIYSTNANHWGRPLLKYLSEVWSQGDIHTTDIEFCRFFAKFIEISRSDSQLPTTKEILMLHEKLLEDVDIAKSQDFSHDPEDPPQVADVCFLAKHQIDNFNINPICRALIVIIENTPTISDDKVEEQLVRLVLTNSATEHKPFIDFENLEIQKVINENEVVVVLAEAVRFIMDLNEKEVARQEKRDPTVLETWLGDPKEQIAFIEKAANRSEPMWTAGFWPTGPSTKWWEMADTLNDTT